MSLICFFVFIFTIHQLIVLLSNKSVFKTFLWLCFIYREMHIKHQASQCFLPNLPSSTLFLLGSQDSYESHKSLLGFHLYSDMLKFIEKNLFGTTLFVYCSATPLFDIILVRNYVGEKNNLPVTLSYKI